MAEEKNGHTVGVQIPDRLFQVINLYTTVRGGSYSNILREGLLLWIDHEGIDIEDMIKELARSLKTQWLINKNKDKEASFKQFKADCRSELESSKISDYIIDRVFKLLDENTNEKE